MHACPVAVCLLGLLALAAAGSDFEQCLMAGATRIAKSGHLGSAFVDGSKTSVRSMDVWCV